MPPDYGAAGLNQPNTKFSEIQEVNTRSTGPGSHALPPDKTEDAEQNKTNMYDATCRYCIRQTKPKYLHQI